MHYVYAHNKLNNFKIMFFGIWNLFHDILSRFEHFYNFSFNWLLSKLCMHCWIFSLITAYALHTEPANKCVRILIPYNSWCYLRVLCVHAFGIVNPSFTTQPHLINAVLCVYTCVCWLPCVCTCMGWYKSAKGNINPSFRQVPCIGLE